MEGLLQGEFCYVLTSRQMGKSSLMVRTANKLREQGISVIALDLTAIGQNLTPEQWYDGLIVRMGRQLRLEDELENFWLNAARIGPLQRWQAAISEIILPKLKERAGTHPEKSGLVIFVDETDTVRSLPFSTEEFFAAIREFYNRRTADPELSGLTFCLLGVATPSDLIRDTRTTPFNIGRRIELNDFTGEEALPLAVGLDLEHSEEETGRDLEEHNRALLKRMLFWTHGHPYLTQRLCQAVTKDPGLTTEKGVVEGSAIVAAVLVVVGASYIYYKQWKQDHKIDKVIQNLGRVYKQIDTYNPYTSKQTNEVKPRFDPEKLKQTILTRDSKAGPNQINLGSYYNAPLTEPWHSNRPGNDLAELPRGLQQFGGVLFEVRGLIQLVGKGEPNLSEIYPEKVNAIKANALARKIHFLHGTGWYARDGTQIGNYIVHYADGEKRVIPIIYGFDVRNWWSSTNESVNQGLEMAWTGKNAQTPTVRVYKTSWPNSRPSVEIRTIDFVSAMNDPAPFLIAITAEP